MYIKRDVENVIKLYSKQYPVITITGPRQSGKTTLIRNIFDLPYYSMETPDIRERILSDPRSFFDSLTKGCILDESQRTPELLSYIQEYVDRPNNKLKFILSGSQQLNLLNSISQSLAGRTALIKLLPFSTNEVNIKNKSINDIIFKGFYPRLYDKKLNPTQVYRDYFETYIQRDVRQLLNIKDIHAFQKFVYLCAGRIGQLLNTNSLANEVGVSVKTIQSWISVLEASYIVFLLYPYNNNINKRVVKTPKLYFCDPGLACYLLGIENAKQLENNMYRGNLFENFIILELIKHRYNKGLDKNIYFYRDSNSNEVDCIAEWNNNIVPFEIKVSKTFSSDFLKGIQFIKNIIPGINKNFVVYTGKENFKIKDIDIINFNQLTNIL